MRVSAKVDYAVRAAAELAASGPGPVKGEALSQGLELVRREFEDDSFLELEGDEDIHTAVERRLRELVGEPALKLHTGRSRNDQVATTFRIFAIGAARQIEERALKRLSQRPELVALREAA